MLILDIHQVNTMKIISFKLQNAVWVFIYEYNELRYEYAYGIYVISFQVVSSTFYV